MADVVADVIISSAMMLRSFRQKRELLLYSQIVLKPFIVSPVMRLDDHSSLLS